MITSLVISRLSLLLAIHWAGGGVSHTPCPPTQGISENRISVHGRAHWANGAGSTVWIVGTNRKIALLYDDRRFPTFSRYVEEPEEPNVFADFELVPLQPEWPGIMREACLCGISNIVVQRERENGSKYSFRVKDCPECTPHAK